MPMKKYHLGHLCVHSSLENGMETRRWGENYDGDFLGSLRCDPWNVYGHILIGLLSPSFYYSEEQKEKESPP